MAIMTVLTQLASFYNVHSRFEIWAVYRPNFDLRMSGDYEIDYILRFSIYETSLLPSWLGPESRLRYHRFIFGFQSQILANPLISITDRGDGTSDIRRKAKLSAHPG